MSVRERIRRTIKGWLYSHVYLKREPDLFIGGREQPYMLRWYILPRNPIFNIYFHIFLRSDYAEALHDHPWLFNASFLLDGSYTEIVFNDKVDRGNRVKLWLPARPARGWQSAEPAVEVLRPLPKQHEVERTAGDFAFRWGKAPHRVQLHPQRSHGDTTGPVVNGVAYNSHPGAEDSVSTLFITGPKIGGWGFYCKRGWKRWQEFLGKYESAHEGLDTNGCD